MKRRIEYVYLKNVLVRGYICLLMSLIIYLKQVRYRKQLNKHYYCMQHDDGSVTYIKIIGEVI